MDTKVIIDRYEYDLHFLRMIIYLTMIICYYPNPNDFIWIFDLYLDQ